MSEIIRVVEDGVEFFTVTATGESGMSQSGLARLCGVDEGAVRKLLKLVRTSSSDKFLESLWDKELTLRTSCREYKNAPDGAVIMHPISHRTGFPPRQFHFCVTAFIANCHETASFHERRREWRKLFTVMSSAWIGAIVNG